MIEEKYLFWLFIYNCNYQRTVRPGVAAWGVGGREEGRESGYVGDSGDSGKVSRYFWDSGDIGDSQDGGDVGDGMGGEELEDASLPLLHHTLVWKLK